MDLVCIGCGEPWEMDHVLHEDPIAFERDGGVVTRCPTCPDKSEVTDRERDRREAIAEIGLLLGDDIDGHAAMIEDLGLV